MKTEPGASQNVGKPGGIVPPLVYVIFAGVGIPLLGTLALTHYLPDWRWMSLPFDSTLAVGGACAGLFLALHLLMQAGSSDGSTDHMWIGCALIGMAVGDIFRGSVAVGPAFVWLHAAGALIGGMLIFMVCLPARPVGRWTAYAAAGMTAVFAAVTSTIIVIYPSFLPAIQVDGAFSPAVEVVNFLGGGLFLFAGFSFCVRYLVGKQVDDLVYAFLWLLFGMAGVMFLMSGMWHAGWWYRHLIRSVAFLTCLTYVMMRHRRQLRMAENLQSMADRIFMVSQDAKRLIDMEFNIMRVNDAFLAAAGVDRELSMSVKCYEVLSSANCHTPLCPVNLLKAGRESTATESIKYRMDGTSFACIFHWAALTDANNRPVGVIESCLDISERKKAEDALRRENELKTGVTALSNALRGDHALPDLGRNVIASICKFLECPTGAIYIMEDSRLRLLGSYAFKKRKNVSSEFSLGEGIVGQCALEREDIILTNVPDDYITISSGLGETSPKNIMVLPVVRNDHVRAVIELGSLNDFTEFHADFLAQVKESIAIAIESSQGRSHVQKLLEQSQKMAEELQVQQEELRVANEELEEQAKALKESEAHLQQQQEELRVTNEELEEHSKAMEEQKEAVRAKNVELERARGEADRKARELELSGRYKSEFLSTMSHELRTPLNSILLLSQLLFENKDKTLGDKQLEFAQTIHASGKDLLNLINDILDLSKIEAGKADYNEEELKLEQLIEEIERKFKPMAADKGLRLRFELQQGLPVAIRTDAQKLRQIVGNLLSNSLKFTEDGEVTLSIHRPVPGVDLSRSGLPHGMSIAVAVSDTGIGIAEEKLEAVFEPFRQADGTTTRKYGGTGLGLSISRSLAAFLGGELQVRSEEGKGSVFTLYVPERSEKTRGPGKETQEPKPREMEEIPRVSSVANAPFRTGMVEDDRKCILQGDKCILIIEDDPKFSKVLLDLARERGFKGLVAEDGETGLHLADYYKPSAIMLDVQLPGMDGLEVMARLKNNPVTLHIPVHFISVSDKSTATMQMGAVGFLKKPVTLEGLINAFEKVEQAASGYAVQPAASAEGVLEEATLFLHRVEADLPEARQRTLKIIHDKEAVFENKKVLIVDDDMRNVFALSSVLEGKGIQIVVGKSGKEGLEKLDGAPDMDLVIMDIMMPEMDGFEAITEIRKQERFRKLPIIALTAKAMKGDRNRCIEAGANDYLAKPVDVAKLLSMLRVWLFS